jgi:hypothetical protein
MHASIQPIVAAYVYPGWHACPERDASMGPGWSEWDLVLRAKPHFPGHNQPRVPLSGPYDDSKPETAAFQTALARKYGIDVFVYGFFWSRGKRVFETALDSGFLGPGGGGKFPFCLMWANRMPRGVLPVRIRPKDVIDPGRLVATDPEDFCELAVFAAERYFSRPGYFRIKGRPLFSIFDSAFFVRQMGEQNCRAAVEGARARLRAAGFPDFHLMAINPAPAFMDLYRSVGFDSVTHYVHLPEWKGAYLQEYRDLAGRRAAEWQGFAEKTGLTYFPSLSPGWDATPRAVQYAKKRPRRYPWWPVVTGEDPELFLDFLRRGVRFSLERNDPPLVFIASFNEWSEGHYLEPDRRFHAGWLEAVREARRG